MWQRTLRTEVKSRQIKIHDHLIRHSHSNFNHILQVKFEIWDGKFIYARCHWIAEVGLVRGFFEPNQSHLFWIVLT
jgi:hypothetical protein